MKLNARSARIAGLIALVFALYIFNQGGRAPRSQAQLDYDNWLIHIEPRISELADSLSEKQNESVPLSNSVGANSVGANSVGANSVGANSVGANSVGKSFPDTAAIQVQLPTVSVSIGYGSAAMEKSFVFSPQRKASELRKLLRVLQLIREADIITLSDKQLRTAIGEASVRMMVTDGQTQFRAEFSSADISNNSPALLMLRLLEEYAALPSKIEPTTEVVFDGKA